MRRFPPMLAIAIGFAAFCIYQKPSIAPEVSPSPQTKKIWAKQKKLEFPGLFLEAMLAIKTGPAGERYQLNYRNQELRKAKKAKKTGGKRLNWQSRGPLNVSGRVRAVIADKSDQSGMTWFAATIGGGVWKTSDAGETWVAKTDNIVTLSATCIVQSSSNPDILYLGTGMGYGRVVDLLGSGVWKSTDHGESWFQLPSTANGQVLEAINRIVVDPNDPNVVVLCSNNAYSHLGPKGGEKTSGIFKSTDGGDTWFQTFDPDQQFTSGTDNRVQQIITDPTNFNNLYASINEVGVVRSTDAGDTWIVSADHFALPSDIGNPVGGPAGYNPVSVRTELAIAPSEPNRLYAAVERPRGVADLYMTSDSGQTWSLINDTGNDPNWFNGSGLSGATGAYCAGWFDNTIAVHPFDANVVFVGGVHLYRIQVSPQTLSRTTSNSGFIPLGNGNFSRLHPDHHWLEMITLPGQANFWVLNGNDGGVGISMDQGNTWQQKSGMVTTQFYGVDKNPLKDQYIGGTQDNGTWVSEQDPGPDGQWRHVIGGDGFESAWHHTNPKWLLGGSQYNGIGRSTDNGNSWERPDLSFLGSSPFITHIASSKLDPDLVFAFGQNGIARSENFGKDWALTPITQNWTGYRPFSNVEISKANPLVVWATSRILPDPASGLPGGVHVSNDSGLTFQNITSSLPPNLTESSGLGTHPFDANTAYLLFSTPGAAKVWKTEDLGQTWVDLSQFQNGSSQNGFPDVGIFSFISMPHDPNTMWVASEIGLIESTDGGGTWSLADNGLPNVAIFELAIVGDEVLVATQGRGIWTLTIPELLQAPSPQFTLSPRILSAAQNPNGLLHVEAEIRGKYESVELRVDGESLWQKGPNTKTGVVDIWLDQPAGELNLQLEAETSSQALLKSGLRKVRVEPVTQITNLNEDFNQNSDTTRLSGLSLTTAGNISSRAVHTPHNYAINTRYEVYLKDAIRISEEGTTLSYQDIALIEPGELGSVYGDVPFWDFVVVEGSNNGTDWIALAPGYDARFNQNWLQAYGAGLPPTNSMFVNHNLQLLDHFLPGDDVFIRWRVESDPGVTGWGWVMDNVVIEGQGQAEEIQSDLVYSWVSYNETFESLVILNNPNDVPAKIHIFGQRNDLPLLEAERTIPANGFLKEKLNTLFPSLEKGSGLMLRARSSLKLDGSWVTYQTAGSGLSPSMGNAVNFQILNRNQELTGRKLLAGYLPAEGGNISAPVLMHGKQGIGDMVGYLFSKEGTLIQQERATFDSLHGFYPTPFLLEAATWQQPLAMQIEAFTAASGVGFVFNEFSEPAIGNLQSLDFDIFQQDTDFVLPWVSLNDRFISLLVVNNLEDEAVTIELIARRGDGSLASTLRTIEGNGFLAEQTDSLFSNFESGSGICVEIKTNGANCLGRWVTYQLDAPSGFSPSQGISIPKMTTENSTLSGTKMLFSFLPTTSGFISAPVFVNLSDEPNDITMRFYDESGQLVAEDTTTLSQTQPLLPFAQVANTLIPAGSGDVMLIAEGQLPFTGVVFVFNGLAEPAIGNATRLQ